MTEFNIDNLNKKGINWSDIKDGVKKDAFSNDKSKLIFDLLDSDKNEVLDYKETYGFYKQYNTDKHQDFLSKGEIKNFYKNNKSQLEPLGIKEEDLFAFFVEYITNSEGITGTSTTSDHDIVINYKNGKEEFIHPDLTSTVKYTDENNKNITEEYSVDKELLKRTVTYKTENGDNVFEEYSADNTLQKRTVDVNKDNIPLRDDTFNLGTAIRTINGKTEVCNSWDEYQYINGERVIVSSEISLPDNKKEYVKYSYEDGIETRTITNGNKQTIQHYTEGHLTDETITKGNKKTEIEYNSAGTATNTVEYKLKGDKKYRLSQTKIVNGQKYTAKYDGNGHTKVVMQAGWDYAKLAQEFKTSENTVKRINGNKTIPQAGQTILVPGEFEAEIIAQKCPQSKKEAEAIGNAAEQVLNDEADSRHYFTMQYPKHYTSYKELAKDLYSMEGNKNPTEMQLLKRAQQIEKYQKGLGYSLKDDIGPVFVSKECAAAIEEQKDKNDIKEWKRYEKQEDSKAVNICSNILKDKSLNRTAKKITDNITKDNIVRVMKIFSENTSKLDLISYIFIRFRDDESDIQWLCYHLLDTLNAAAKEAGVPSDRLASLDWNDCNNKEKVNAAVKNILHEITTAEYGSYGTISNTDSRKMATGVIGSDFDQSNNNLKQYEKEWNWADYAGDAIYSFFGGKNNISNKKAQWAKYSKQIQTMKTAKDYKTFNAAYKQIFGKNFNPRQALAVKNLTNTYREAAGYDALIHDIEYAKESASPDGINGIEGCYDRAASALNLIDNELETLVKAYAKGKGKSFENNKYKLLQEFLSVYKRQVNNKLQQTLYMSKSKSTSELGQKLQAAESTLYAGRKEFVTDINEFNKGVKEGGMYVQIGAEILISIALSAVGGTLLSGAANLSRAQKMLRLAQFVEKGRVAVTTGSAYAANAITQQTTTGKVNHSEALKSAVYAYIGAKSSKFAEKFGEAAAGKISNKFLSKCAEKGVTEITEDTCDILASLLIECGNYSSDDAIMDVTMNFVLSRFSGGTGRRAVKKADKEVTSIINKLKKHKQEGKIKSAKDCVEFFNSEYRATDSKSTPPEAPASMAPLNSPFVISMKTPNNKNSDNGITQNTIKDDAGRIIKHTCTDQNGNITSNVEFEYDNEGRKTKAIYTTLNEGVIKVDNSNNPLPKQNGKEYHITEITYDSAGRETSRNIRIEYLSNNTEIKSEIKPDNTSTRTTPPPPPSAKEQFIQNNPDFEEILSKVEDKKIKDYIEKELSRKDLSYNELDSIYYLASAINEFNGLHIALKDPSQYTGNSDLTNFRKYVGSLESGFETIDGTNTPKALENHKNAKALNFDLAAEGRIYSMRRYIKENPNSEMSNYLYDNYYLQMQKESGIPKDILTKINDINKNYGTKIFVSGDLTDSSKALEYTEKELKAWKKASNGTAKIPPVIDFSSVKSNWYDQTSAYGSGVAAGFSECYTNGSISLANMTESSVAWAIRHEIMHSNDTKRGNNLPEKYGDLSNRENMEARLGNYKNEFKNAGLSDHSINYAYNNSLEFIAVAAQGDMSKYSPEFKQVLIDLGMPEWSFKLEDVKLDNKQPAQSILSRLFKGKKGKLRLNNPEILLKAPEQLIVENGSRLQ